MFQSSIRTTTLAMFCLFLGGAASAGESVKKSVDMLLVLAGDVTLSMTDDKFELQRNGYAEAITHPQVLEAIRSGRYRRIAASYVEWANKSQQKVIIDWSLIDNADSAALFAAKLIKTPRPFSGPTSISAAIDFSVEHLQRAPFSAERSVIDISGDGTNMKGRLIQLARNDAVSKDITINALVILTQPPHEYPFHTDPSGGIVKYFRENVIGGPGAFLIVADGYQSFGRHMMGKLVKEVASR